MLLSLGSRQRRPRGVQLLANGVYNYEQFDYSVPYIGNEAQRDLLLRVQCL